MFGILITVFIFLLIPKRLGFVTVNAINNTTLNVINNSTSTNYTSLDSALKAISEWKDIELQEFEVKISEPISITKSYAFKRLRIRLSCASQLCDLDFALEGQLKLEDDSSLKLEGFFIEVLEESVNMNAAFVLGNNTSCDIKVNL